MNSKLNNVNSEVRHAGYNCRQGQRYNAFDNGMIKEYAGLSNRKRKALNRVRHARNLELGTIAEFASNRITFSDWDKQHVISKLTVQDSIPACDMVSDTICRRNIFNQLHTDISLKQHYKGDKTALNKMVSKR